jgi:hypothetical protein
MGGGLNLIRTKAQSPTAGGQGGRPNFAIDSVSLGLGLC